MNEIITEASSIAKLREAGVPNWALQATDRVLGGPAARHHARVMATIGAVTEHGWMLDYLQPVENVTTWMQDYALGAMLLALDVGGAGGPQGLGDWKVDPNDPHDAPRAFRSARSFPFTNLGKSRWRAGDGPAYRAAALDALRALARVLEQHPTGGAHDLVEAAKQAAVYGAILKFQVSVSLDSGRPTHISWAGHAAAWPDLTWASNQTQLWPDMPIQGLAALRTHESGDASRDTVLRAARSLNAAMHQAGRAGYRETLEATCGVETFGAEAKLGELADDIAKLAAMLPLVERLEAIAQAAFAATFARSIQNGGVISSIAFATVEGITLQFELASQ